MDAQLAKAEKASANSGTNISSQRMHPAVEASLVDNHSAFLRFLISRLRDKDTAEDVLQQFYLRVVSRGAELRETKSVVAWLYTVLRTTLIDHYRREASRRNRESDYALMETLTEERWDAAPQDGDYACLYEVLPTLRPEYSDVLRRVDLSEAPPRKVAGDLGIAANTVRVRLHRARQALKRALLQRCGSCAEHGCLDCECNNPRSYAVPTEEYQPISV